MPAVEKLAQLFVSSGKHLYLVGGTVRDAFLGEIHEDLDFATDAVPKEVIKIVRDFADELWLVGIKFGTVGLAKDGLKIEITTFRREVYPRDERHPLVTFSREIEVDLSRRDFTINAMAVEVPSGKLIDPFGGRSDLERGLLRTPIGPRQSFLDDPLRMMRAARFVSTLRMSVVAEVREAMAKYHEALSIVSKERIRDEFSKILTSDYPVEGLRLMIDTGLIKEAVPELLNLKLAQDPEYRHKDILEHTLMVVKTVESDLVLRLAALLHDIGKPLTREVINGKVTFYNHDVVGARIARKRLRELRYPKEVVEAVIKLISMHMRAYSYRMGWTDSAVRRYVRDAGDLLPKLLALVRADCTSRILKTRREALTALDDLEKRIKRLEEEEESAKIRPPLNGHEVMDYLGIEPGPLVGEALRLLLDAKLEGNVTTKEEAYKLLDNWAREKKLK
jgi:poly(A) polymerase